METANTPKHVAIIMDGNGRWAKQRHLPRVMGHQAGVKAVRRTVKKCIESHISVLSLFAFSSENWLRPQGEVSFLMQLFMTVLQREVKKLHTQNVQLILIGDRSRFDAKLQHMMAEAESLTANNTGLKLVVAANYGGQWDIAQAVRKLAVKVAQGELSAENIDADLIGANLSRADLPLPDLLIRTSGEKRISNYLIWQLAYSELYFTDVYWPDFNAQEFDKALAAYANRERRFGCISEQLSTTSC